MILYSPNNTPRLSYVVDFINKELFNDTISITTDQAIFSAYSGPKLNYSEQEFSDEEFFIKATPLLFEKGIRLQPLECFELNFYKVFFETTGDYPFDILAAIFYLLSRYEEYLPHEEDEFGRFSHTSSLAFKEGFLETPLVNFWLQDFRKSLHEKFPDLIFRHSYFKFIPTYDIDIAYSYLHKGWFRNTGGLIRSIFKGEWSLVQDRIRVLMQKKKDPYDAYEWLDSLHLYCRMRAYYFFLVARQQKGYDKNISPDKEALQNLIRYHANGYTVGIHPSWQSGDDNYVLKSEIEWLAEIVNKKVTYSRQHYIRLKLPKTYQNLIRFGIDKDFSMGYGGANGFRASVASSFYWYDLENEKQTELMLFPFCFMDATSFYQKKISAQQTLQELMNYYHVIKKVNGLMVTIWHNNFLGLDPQFAGWKEVYEVFIKDEVYWDM
ncbi:MAG: hypothetical protein C5B59_20920 [Bacteroidetes bacterium]|nr:MAG: hypothetical protein C5B59_20920 [Bacteroidota bacterium]